MEHIIIRRERLCADEYIDFLKRTDLGSQYPKERFRERIEKLVQHAAISLVARNNENTIVGVLFAITDFAYWMFITDLGVDRAYVKQGIGKRLFEMAVEDAGGKENIIVYTNAYSKAIPFYEKMGMKRSEDDIMEINEIPWTHFVVE